MTDGAGAEAAAFAGTGQGGKVARKFFAEIMDVLDEYVPGCSRIVRGDYRDDRFSSLDV
jgi:hypothetical protein